MSPKRQPSRPSHWANASGTLFKNPWPSAEEPSWGELYKSSPLSFYAPDLHIHSHARDIKVVRPDWGAEALKSKSRGEQKAEFLIGTWLGHAGALVEIPRISSTTSSARTRSPKDSIHLVFDPIFSYRAGPNQYVGPARFREAPCQIPDLPGCNAVFISHNHYDHLDLGSVTGILKAFPDTMWFVPLGNKQWMIETGVKEEKIVELDWWGSWESETTNGGLRSGSGASAVKLKARESALKITCVPAQHNTGRTRWDKDRTLWSGWVIERFVGSDDSDSGAGRIRKGSIYHAGDTGYRKIKNSPVTCPIFKEIGSKFGGFDLSFVPIWRGGTLGFISYWGLRLSHDAIPAAHHTLPADAVDLHKDVKSRNTIGVHFGTFIGSENESYDSVIEFKKACEENKVQDLGVEDSANGRFGLVDIGASTVVEIG